MTVVFRVVKTKNYTMMSNRHLKDKRLTLKAKGLMSVMLSLPENWDLYAAGAVGNQQRGRGRDQRSRQGVGAFGLCDPESKTGRARAAERDRVPDLRGLPHEQPACAGRT